MKRCVIRRDVLEARSALATVTDGSSSCLNTFGTSYPIGSRIRRKQTRCYPRFARIDTFDRWVAANFLFRSLSPILPRRQRKGTFAVPAAVDVTFHTEV